MKGEFISLRFHSANGIVICTILVNIPLKTKPFIELVTEKVKLFESERSMKDVLPANEIKTIRIGKDRYSAVLLNGQLHFMEYGCPHMGYPLFQAVATPFNEISCPWHNYRFNLETGIESNQRCRPLKRYEVIIDTAGVSVMLPKQSQTQP